jgi:hypothetical protein
MVIEYYYYSITAVMIMMSATVILMLMMRRSKIHDSSNGKNKKKTNSGSKLYFVSSRNPRLQRPGTTWATESLQARHHPAQSSPWKEITMTRHDSHVQP